MGAWPCAVPGTALPGTAVRALGGARDQDPCRPNTRLSHRGKSEVLNDLQIWCSLFFFIANETKYNCMSFFKDVGMW